MTDIIRRLVRWVLAVPTPPLEAPPATARLHIPRSVLTSLRRHTSPNLEHVEALALLRVRYASESSRDVVVGIGAIPFPDCAYAPGPAGANFDTDWLVGIANQEIGSNVGLMLVHAHGGTGMPSFSSVDRRTNAQVMAPLSIGLEEAPYGAMVLASDEARAVVTVGGCLSTAEVVTMPDRLGGLEAR